MRVLMVPVIAIGLIGPGPSSDEPDEAGMRAAFTASLSAQVNAVIDYAAETGGVAAVDSIRRAGTDRFEIRGFHKIGCIGGGARPGYVCTFAVELGVITGELRHTIIGRFTAGPSGLSFSQDETTRDELVRAGNPPPRA
jgi:hypothetical protein